MSLVCVGSCTASPGASTLAVGLSLTWQATVNRSCLLVEADPDGGVLAARFGLSLHPSLVDLAALARHGFEPSHLQTSCQQLAGGLPVLVAPGSPDQAETVLASFAGVLAEGLAHHQNADVVVDVGRLRPRTPALPLLQRSSLVVLVARPRFEELVPLAHRARSLQENQLTCGLVCVGAAPYPPAEMAEAAGLELLGVMAHDPATAGSETGPGVGRRQQRSPLWQSLGECAEQLGQRLQLTRTAA